MMRMSSDQSSTAREAGVPAPAYIYPPPLVPGSGQPTTPAAGSASTLEHLWTGEAKPAAPPGPTEEQVRAREERARQEGREQGAAQGRADFDKRLAVERQTLAQTIREFAQQRANYFHRVEAEVVTLAVAIARKILHREVQLDPLLLAGVVHVALNKLAVGTHVRLKMHPAHLPAWREFFGQQADLPWIPELIADASLSATHCSLETEMGSADLTLETQLKEIEQGFFDLLAQKPGTQPNAPPGQ